MDYAHSNCIMYNNLILILKNQIIVKADFHSVESSERTGNLLFTTETVALNLNKILRVTDLLLCLFLSARKILLSGNQP